jgi:hypothetical protein
MTAYSRREVCDQLGIRPEALSTLIKRGVLRGTSFMASGHPVSTGGQRVFDEDVVAAAQEALVSLRWLCVVSKENWKRLTADSLTYTLLSERYRANADLIRKGNRLAFYVAGAGAFGATAEVTASPASVRTVWPSGAYSIRVPLRSIQGPLKNWLPVVQPLLPALSFVRNKAEWEMCFRRAIRLIANDDFDVSERALMEANDDAN